MFKEFQSKYQEVLENSQKLEAKNTQIEKKLKETQLYEKRLMYLIYLSVEEGYPVDKIYEERVGNLSSRIFEDISNNPDNSSLFNSWLVSIIPKHESEIKLVDESNTRSSQIFDSNASYELIKTGPPACSNKPSFIKNLNLDLISEYKSSFNEGKNSKYFSGVPIMTNDPLIRFRRWRSADDIYLSICSPSQQ